MVSAAFTASGKVPTSLSWSHDNRTHAEGRGETGNRPCWAAYNADRLLVRVGHQPIQMGKCLKGSRHTRPTFVNPGRDGHAPKPLLRHFQLTPEAQNAFTKFRRVNAPKSFCKCRETNCRPSDVHGSRPKNAGSPSRDSNRSTIQKIRMHHSTECNQARAEIVELAGFW